MVSALNHYAFPDGSTYCVYAGVCGCSVHLLIVLVIRNPFATKLAFTFIGAISAAFIYKTFGLILTVPLLMVGTTLVITSRTCRSQLARTLGINAGLTMISGSIIFTALNIGEIGKEAQITKTANQSSSSVIQSSNDSRSLGYAYKPGVNKFIVTVTAIKNNIKMPVYSAQYNIDRNGNRATPSIAGHTLKNNDSIMFVGDSLTFGEGLNDNETLSYFLQSKTGRVSINTGMHGYGAHQSLRVLEDEALFKERTSPNRVKTVIYRALVNHINRSAGYSPWDAEGPCYQLNQLNKPVFRGSFVDCKLRSTNLLSKIVNRLAASSEPWTQKFAKRLTTYNSYATTNYKEVDISRFLAIVREMQTISKNYGANFVLIIEDFERHGDKCGSLVPFSERLIARLSPHVENIVRTSSVYSKELCAGGQLYISEYDTHPSRKANELIANYLWHEKILDF